VGGGENLRASGLMSSPAWGQRLTRAFTAVPDPNADSEIMSTASEGAWGCTAGSSFQARRRRSRPKLVKNTQSSKSPEAANRPCILGVQLVVPLSQRHLVEEPASLPAPPPLVDALVARAGLPDQANPEVLVRPEPKGVSPVNTEGRGGR